MANSIKIIDAKILKSWLTDKECMLIDVREPFEYAESHIEGALNIPLSELLNKLDVIAAQNKKLVLQCAAGVRSMNGCISLEKEDLQLDLYNLAGGIKTWIKEGFPVI